MEAPREIDYVCGAAFMIRKEVLERIGFLDPRYFLIWEESDFCFRARRAGFTTMTCPDAVLWHKVSASFTGGKPHSTYFWWRNRLLWIENNCPLGEKIRLYLTRLIPAILHTLKMYLLKQLHCSLCFIPKKRLLKKQQIRQNRAVLRGVWDYLRRRFGDGPSWLYEKF